jgi:hypothetical protein
MLGLSGPIEQCILRLTTWKCPPMSVKFPDGGSRDVRQGYQIVARRPSAALAVGHHRGA